VAPRCCPGGTATINRTTFKLSKAGSTNNVGAAVAYNAASQKAVLNPNNGLAAGTKYKAVVTIGARDLAGNTLDQKPTTAGNQQKAWTLTTKGQEGQAEQEGPEHRALPAGESFNRLVNSTNFGCKAFCELRLYGFLRSVALRFREGRPRDACAPRRPRLLGPGNESPRRPPPGWQHLVRHLPRRKRQ